MRALMIFGLAVFAALSVPAAAEPPNGPVPSTTVDPKRLAQARAVVFGTQGDKDALLAAMKGPLAAIVDQAMREKGVVAPDKAKVVTEEVLMPVLAARYDELLSIQALAFAAVLSKEDLQAIAAFYATPAGRRLIQTRPQLTQASMVGVRQWMTAVMPELQDKVAAFAQANGWIPGGSNDKPKPN